MTTQKDYDDFVERAFQASWAQILIFWVPIILLIIGVFMAIDYAVPILLHIPPVSTPDAVYIR